MEYSKMGISTELFTDSATGTSEGRDTLGVCLNAFSPLPEELANTDLTAKKVLLQLLQRKSILSLFLT